MSGAEQITLYPAIPGALAAVVLGSLALWANPRRVINRVFFSGSLHVAAWLLCVELALISPDGLFWLRLASAVGAFLPVHLWIVKESVRGVPGFWSPQRWWAWGFFGAVLALLCFTTWFIPAHSTGEARVYGLGYYLYIGGVLALYLLLFVQTLLQARATSGVQRLELQVLLLGGCAACFTVIGLMVANAVTHDVSYIYLQQIVVLVFYGFTAWAMSTTRVFDAKHMLYIGLQKLFLTLAVAFCMWSANELLVLLVPPALAFVIAIGVALWFAAVSGPWFQHIFDLDLNGEATRREAFELGRRESRPERLEEAFGLLLKNWAKADRAVILTSVQDRLVGGGLDLALDGKVADALNLLRWVTPERLSRQNLGPAKLELQAFMEREQLGVMAACGDDGLSVVIAVGLPERRRPFTYPQVALLVELAAILESALERAHFAVKAQHAEQLATVGLLGASLAHEIRNPLVTIKTFVQLLPKHHQDAAFREKFFRLIGGEVERIDRLTEQLLDLAAPRIYTSSELDLHPVLLASIELLTAKAADRNTRIVTELQAKPDRVYTDATAAKQVLLNLCFNALQAVETSDGERWIRVATRNQGDRIEVIVEDSGAGIAPDILPRLFKPFQSTKSSGFGLGLAICSDILAGLKATIAVDTPVPGRGAVFRVKFPCQA